MTGPGKSPQAAARRFWADEQTRTAVKTIAWVYLGTLLVFWTMSFLRGQFSSRVTIGMGVPMMLEAFLELLPFYALRMTRGQPKHTRWPIVVVAAIIDSLLAAVWDTQLRVWTGQLLIDFHNASFLNGIARALPVDVWHTCMLVALFAFQEAYYDLRDNQQRLQASQESERGAHLAALRLQLNPHFLFNSMNALSGLVMTGRPAEAEAMIERLSAFLRATLTADLAALVPLDEEFELLETYLDVERVRFGDRLRCEFDLPDTLAAVHVPPFLLQPLVENAVKYAVAPSRRPVCVRVSAVQTSGFLELIVSDDGEGCQGVAGGTGVGLANIRQRVSLEYGGAAALDAGCVEVGYRAVIRIPMARTAELVTRLNKPSSTASL